MRDLNGLLELFRQKKIESDCEITRVLYDFGAMDEVAVDD